MANLDTTALSILAGILTASAYTIVRRVRQRSFDIGSPGTLFLAGAAIPAFVHLIFAGFTGNTNDLPTDWRTYVGVAGIGLAVKSLFELFGTAWIKEQMAIAEGQLI